MNKQLLKDGIGWGLILWLIGYILGIVLFAFVPQTILGWLIMPIGVVITWWVLSKKVKSKSINHYAVLAVAWTTMAIILDYLFIVIAFKSTTYYKLDVYVYYLLTLILPLLVGCRKSWGNQ